MSTYEGSDTISPRSRSLNYFGESEPPRGELLLTCKHLGQEKICVLEDQISDQCLNQYDLMNEEDIKCNILEQL